MDYLDLFSSNLTNVKHTYGDEYIAQCPFHEDTKPSFGFNVGKGVWICRSGCGEGGYKAFAERVGKKVNARPSVKANFKPVEKFKQLDEHWHILMDAYVNHFMGKMMKGASKKYGWLPKVVLDCIVGYDIKDNCLTFGIHDIKGNLTNIKWHKKRGIKGHNSNTIYPMYYFGKYQFDKPLYIVEGEKDVITAISKGNQAICLTAGCGSKIPEKYMGVLSEFEDIRIFYDNDRAGIEGSKKLIKQLARD